MMPRFIIVLKNSKLRTYTVISWLIIALNFFAFAYVGLRRAEDMKNLPFFAAAILAGTFIFQLFTRREETMNDSLSLGFCVAIIAWIVMQYYWAAGLMILLFLFQDITRRKLAVLFFEDRIVYPSFPKRTITWDELNNVIIKDTILTIDLKNNRVYQNEVISPVSDIEFNEYCDAHLQSR
jgi:hypothetical protein